MQHECNQRELKVRSHNKMIQRDITTPKPSQHESATRNDSHKETKGMTIPLIDMIKARN